MSLVGGGSLLIGAIPAVLYMERFGCRYWANVMLPGLFIGLTSIILWIGFFGSYACLSWVVPSEVFHTYLRSYDEKDCRELPGSHNLSGED